MLEVQNQVQIQEVHKDNAVTNHLHLDFNCRIIHERLQLLNSWGRSQGQDSEAIKFTGLPKKARIHKQEQRQVLEILPTTQTAIAQQVEEHSQVDAEVIEYHNR